MRKRERVAGVVDVYLLTRSKPIPLASIPREAGALFKPHTLQKN